MLRAVFLALWGTITLTLDSPIVDAGWKRIFLSGKDLCEAPVLPWGWMEAAGLVPVQHAGRTGLPQHPRTVSLTSQNDFVGATPEACRGLGGISRSLLLAWWPLGHSVPQVSLAP